MTRPALRAVAATAVLLLAAGCGSGGSDSSGSGSSGSSGSDSSSSSSSSDGGTLSKADFATRLQAAQKKAGSMHFTLTSSAGGQTLSGKGEALTGSAAADVTVKIGSQTIETVVKDGDYFIKGLPTEKPWLKLDLDATSGLGAQLGQLKTSSDPSASLKAFAAASSLKKGGSRSVGGVDTTEYDVTISSAALGKALKYPAAITASLPKQLTYVVYVDDKDLTRRLTSSFAVQGNKVTTQIDFSGYGDKVSIEAPPAAQTTTKEPNLGG